MSLKLCLAVILLVAAAFSIGNLTRKANESEAPLDFLITDVRAAIQSADVKRMEELFMPPDSTVEGQNRAANLAEIRKDWAHASKGPPIELEAKRAVIRVEMVDNDPARSGGGHVSGIELTAVLTNDGWRIATMK